MKETYREKTEYDLFRQATDSDANGDRLWYARKTSKINGKTQPVKWLVVKHNMMKEGVVEIIDGSETIDEEKLQRLEQVYQEEQKKSYQRVSEYLTAGGTKGMFDLTPVRR